MSKKDDTVFIGGNPAVTTVSPYKGLNLKYTSSDENTSTDQQLRLACLEAAVTFYEDKADDDAEAVLETAGKFWEFVKSEG